MTRGKKSKPNSLISQYFGFTALLAGSIGGLAGMSYWLYKVWINESEFNWFTFIGLTFLSLLLATIGYIILRTGIEEGEN